MYSQGQTVYVSWHDGWRQGTVSAVRENDRSVKPGCVKVHLFGQGVYQIPLAAIRSDLAFVGNDEEAARAAMLGRSS